MGRHVAACPWSMAEKGGKPAFRYPGRPCWRGGACIARSMKNRID
ncbi:hypothetical protein RAA17_20155 [Komagataeibacter rhaeticus]|nr:hypothetical protein [Komagataeibacter rhaeticus]